MCIIRVKRFQMRLIKIREEQRENLKGRQKDVKVFRLFQLLSNVGDEEERRS